MDCIRTGTTSETGVTARAGFCTVVVDVVVLVTAACFMTGSGLKRPRSEGEKLPARIARENSCRSSVDIRNLPVPVPLATVGIGAAAEISGELTAVARAGEAITAGLVPVPEAGKLVGSAVVCSTGTAGCGTAL